MSRGTHTISMAAALSGALALAGSFSIVSSPAGAQTRLASASSVVYVSASSRASAATCGTAQAPCKTITEGIARAKAGDTVRVGPGVYKEQVLVVMPLHLIGTNAVVNATGLSQGSGTTMDAAGIVVAPSASGSSVQGFSVHGAFGEGILVAGASHVTITGNTVSGNDLGNPKTTKYLECQAQGQVPGDCGEGIHLMSTKDSVVANNTVTGNSGGILVSDELGAASGNRIVHNYVADNLWDCGITLPSHSTEAVGANGALQPSKGGVFGNVVANNTVIGNGTLGDGAGILIAAAAPGGASYDNRIVGNVIEGNGMAGITIHAHAPHQDVSDNVLIANTIGANNLVGDPDAKVFVTTGIVVFSAGPAVSEVMRDNHITNNAQARWTTSNVKISAVLSAKGGVTIGS